MANIRFDQKTEKQALVNGDKIVVVDSENLVNGNPDVGLVTKDNLKSSLGLADVATSGSYNDLTDKPEGLLQLVEATNRTVIVDKDAVPIAGKVFNTYSDAAAYIQSVNSENSEKWTVRFGGGVYDVVLHDRIDIVGNGTTQINIINGDVTKSYGFGAPDIYCCKIVINNFNPSSVNYIRLFQCRIDIYSNCTKLSYKAYNSIVDFIKVNDVLNLNWGDHYFCNVVSDLTDYVTLINFNFFNCLLYNFELGFGKAYNCYVNNIKLVNASFIDCYGPHGQNAHEFVDVDYTSSDNLVLSTTYIGKDIRVSNSINVIISSFLQITDNTVTKFIPTVEGVKITFSAETSSELVFKNNVAVFGDVAELRCLKPSPRKWLLTGCSETSVPEDAIYSADGELLTTADGETIITAD